MAPAGLAEEMQSRPVGYAELLGWPGDDPLAALPPLLATCDALKARPAEPPPAGAGALLRLGARPAAWEAACAEAAALAEGMGQASGPAGQALVRDFLERRFQPFALGSGLLTGYYEPELRGAEYPVSPFLVPLYALPPPPPEGQLLPDRAEIEAGALEGRGLEIAWVDDPIAAFFLHIQGSGRILLNDGRVLRLGFAGKNGHPYRSIGRVLVESGAIPLESISMQAIRDWLAAAGPGSAAALLRQNPSYVFFRPVEGLRPDQGPPGTLGVPLTPGRSLAVDPAFIPLGAPVFVATRDPLDGTPLRRLLLAQDTGSAIRGPARGDIFWGWGEAATARAGRMREMGEIFVLLPREPQRPEMAE
ncbi:MAG: MltA domain-containing protein [Acetobacteraceae bacterium]|nr:MltA domain-containing protein [Acetobacteraceae bacterium]